MNLGDERRRLRFHEGLHRWQALDQEGGQLRALEGTSSDDECSHARAEQCFSFDLILADGAILRNHNPILRTYSGEPVLVLLILLEMIVVELDNFPGLS